MSEYQTLWLAYLSRTSNENKHFLLGIVVAIISAVLEMSIRVIVNVEGCRDRESRAVPKGLKTQDSCLQDQPRRIMMVDFTALSASLFPI